jgi:hypothetical protein
VSETKRFGVIEGAGNKKPQHAKDKNDVELLECRRCEKDVGVAHIDWMEIKRGGYLKKGRLIGFERLLVCAHCYRRGHIEIIGRL